MFEADAAILTVPPPLLSEIALAAGGARTATAIADIGYSTDAMVPTWWTQHPPGHPVLTDWFAGPKTDRVSSLTEAELVDMGLASPAEIFVCLSFSRACEEPC